jgi:hypothetical protein
MRAGVWVAQDETNIPFHDGRHGLVMVVAPTNCLLCFNATNGALIWRGHTNALTWNGLG